MIKIRKATIDDAEGIAKVHVDTWKRCYKGIVPDSYLASLNYDDKTKGWKNGLINGLEENCIIAELNGETIAWVTFGKNRDNRSKDIYELYGIYVLSEYWGSEIGLTLFNHAINKIKNHNPSKITLWVLAENKRAITFYNKNGFEYDGTQKTIDIGDEELSEIRYQKNCY